MSALAENTETVGIGGHPAAGILGETPELVNYDRSKGYPWEPWAAMPERWIVGASSIGKAVSDDWSWWARRVCSKVGAKLRKELAAFTRAEDAERYLYKAADDEQWKPANDGSTVHKFTAVEDAGREQNVELPDRLQCHVDVWREFKARYGVRVGSIERTGYAPTLGHGAAGTIDRLIVFDNHPKVAPHELVAVDLKTKTTQPLSKVKPSLEHLVQIVALTHSTHLAIEEQRTYVELPRITRGLIVYLARDGWRTHLVDPYDPDVLALTEACIAAAALKHRIGQGAFGRPDVQALRGDVGGPALVAPPEVHSQAETEGAAA